jgi:hypothetical protein
MMRIGFDRFIHRITKKERLVVKIDFQVHGAKIGKGQTPDHRIRPINYGFQFSSHSKTTSIYNE